MNRTYLVVPIVSMLVFVGFFLYSQKHPTPRRMETKATEEFASRDGKKEAEAELANGKLVLIETGPAVGWDRERRAIAGTKYGVEIRRLDGTATESLARYVDAFNRVMRPAILTRHGRGFLDQLHRDALAVFESAGTGKKE